jgi:hypothetical protein
LFELPELGCFKLAVQFLLSSQNDLQKFAAAIFQVAQQPNLLEHIPIQIVGLVNDQHGSAARVRALEQHAVERQKDLCLGMVVAAKIEIVGQQFEKLFDGEARIKQGSKSDLLGAQEIAQAFQHRSLTSTDFAGDNHEALAALHAVNQVC